MKTKRILLTVISVVCLLNVFAQHNPIYVADYRAEIPPTHGTKIKTTMPFSPSIGIPTIRIEGIEYTRFTNLVLNLSFSVYNNSFHFAALSSSGGYCPDVWLSVENGKICIYIDEKVYQRRFTVSIFSSELAAYPQYLQGWTVVDAALAGTNRKKGEYQNMFGKVGIGVPWASCELDVNGTIRANEIKVNTDWADYPDFVFKPDYKLPTLDEVETHINNHGHLPGIPSANEASKDGISLGEMNVKLLQKIEELTLYILEQEKRIKKLEERNND